MKKFYSAKSRKDHRRGIILNKKIKIGMNFNHKNIFSICKLCDHSSNLRNNLDGFK